ncbi:MAG: glucosamine-6-phosphate deaminase [Acidobacteriota bacterium]
MTIVVCADHAEASLHVSGLVTSALRSQPSLVLGLPTGRTPVALYAALVAAGLDWSQVRTFNLDEFAHLPPGDAGSFRSFMDAHLFSKVNLAPANIGFLRGDAADERAECARYEQAIQRAGGIDLLLLGLGANGHIGFNEPGPELQAPTHPVSLHGSTRLANADRFGGDPARVPERALTIGMGQVLRARHVVLMATGAAKEAAVAAMTSGPLTTGCPASWLQVHPDLTLVLDREAAAALPPI